MITNAEVLEAVNALVGHELAKEGEDAWHIDRVLPQPRISDDYVAIAEASGSAHVRIHIQIDAAASHLFHEPADLAQALKRFLLEHAETNSWYAHDVLHDRHTPSLRVSEVAIRSYLASDEVDQEPEGHRS